MAVIKVFKNKNTIKKKRCQAQVNKPYSKGKSQCSGEKSLAQTQQAQPIPLRGPMRLGESTCLPHSVCYTPATHMDALYHNICEKMWRTHTSPRCGVAEGVRIGLGLACPPSFCHSCQVFASPKVPKPWAMQWPEVSQSPFLSGFFLLPSFFLFQVTHL